MRIRLKLMTMTVEEWGTCGGGTLWWGRLGAGWEQIISHCRRRRRHHHHHLRPRHHDVCKAYQDSFQALRPSWAALGSPPPGTPSPTGCLGPPFSCNSIGIGIESILLIFNKILRYQKAPITKYENHCTSADANTNTDVLTSQYQS